MTYKTKKCAEEIESILFEEVISKNCCKENAISHVWLQKAKGRFQVIITVVVEEASLQNTISK